MRTTRLANLITAAIGVALAAFLVGTALLLASAL